MALSQELLAEIRKSAENLHQGPWEREPEWVKVEREGKGPDAPVVKITQKLRRPIEVTKGDPVRELVYEEPTGAVVRDLEVSMVGCSHGQLMDVAARMSKAPSPLVFERMRLPDLNTSERIVLFFLGPLLETGAGPSGPSPSDAAGDPPSS